MRASMLASIRLVCVCVCVCVCVYVCVCVSVCECVCGHIEHNYEQCDLQ